MVCNVRRSNNDESTSNRPQSTGLANKPVWTQSGTSDQFGMVLHLASSRPSLMSRQSMAGAGCLHPVAENHVQEGQLGKGGNDANILFVDANILFVDTIVVTQSGTDSIKRYLC